MAEIRIVIADDHVAVREALATFIDSQRDMTVVAQASTGREAVEKTGETGPDVVIIDITMPEGNGIEAIEKIRELYPEVRTLVLTMHEDPTFLRSALAAGGSGYVTKRAAGDELLKAVREVAGGRSYINVSLTDSDITDLLSNPPPPAEETERDPLSEREREVLTLLAYGHTGKEIAAKLGITQTSVDTYRGRISDKLGIKHRAGLVRYALEKGLIGKDGAGSE